MNKAQSIYKSDYVPYGWSENDYDSVGDDFCSEENIDHCLRYISQEFGALGYPSIYTNSSSCPYDINCDIVNYINITYDILRSCSEHTKIKENLEDRNRRLSADLNALCKKNNQLKSNLEQTERKLAGALERERQLKVKNEQITQSLKNEKDEIKKLVSQNQQQKNLYQHESRKYENTIKQMKTRMSQLLSDRNSAKKIASINSSQCLLRNNGQRGKWKNETSANSALEDMYNTLISSYENRCQVLLRDVNEYQQCLQFIQSQMSEIIGVLEDDKSCSTDHIILKSILTRGVDKTQGLKESFQFLFSKVKNKILEKCNNNDHVISEINSLKLKLTEYEKGNKEPGASEMPHKQLDHLENEVISPMDEAAEQNKATNKSENICEEKIELSSSVSLKEVNEELDVQKLNLIKFSMQQRNVPAQWHEELGFIPSISVITRKDGSTGIATANQLKQCLSAPDTFNESLIPLSKSGDCSFMKVLKPRSVSSWPTEHASFQERNFCDTNSDNLKLLESGLPRWAVSRNGTQVWAEQKLNDPKVPLSSESKELNIVKTKLDISSSTEELEVISEPSEELNLQRLKEAMEDIEQRRRQFSPA